jgi:hypothetical protein
MRKEIGESFAQQARGLASLSPRRMPCGELQTTGLDDGLDLMGKRLAHLIVIAPLQAQLAI